MQTAISVRILNESDIQPDRNVYVSDSASPPAIEIVEASSTDASGATYESLLDLGAHNSTGQFLFVVGIELEAGHEEDFDDWYNSEHLPALAAVPGVNRAVRYRKSGTTAGDAGIYPQYLAIYDIASPDIAGNEDWRAAVETPWTTRLRPHFSAVWRGGYRRIAGI
jgi:hypothetical protein